MGRKAFFLVLLVLLGCVVVSSTASAGMIGWWKFDEGTGTVAKDSSGLGHDGTINGTATWVAGVKGGTDGAISLDGKTAYVVIDSVAKSMPANNNFMISAWMKTTGTAGYVIAANDDGGSHAFWFGPASNGNLQVQADSTKNYPPKVNDDKWHMITYVRDGTTAYVYIDGVQVGKETPSGNPASQTRWSIGQEWDPPSPSDFYAGAVDDVRFYDKPVDAAQVKELFLNGTNPTWTKATQPDPADGTPGVTMPMFQWVAGEGAVAHDVYVGLKPELTGADLVGPKQPLNMFFYVPGLQPGVTYYWRVDEIDAAGKVATGTVWSFTAMPLTAWGPQPADGTKNLAPSQTLSWSAGQTATQHQVFFSSNRFDVILGAAAADKGKTAETKLATGQLALKTTYYWRVDEILADGKALMGPVWSFTTAETLEIRVASGADDMEERTATGLPDSGSSDLEMPYESAGTTIGTQPQVVGLRFAVPLPKGTVITKAYVEFTMDEPKGGTQPVNLVIDGQLVPNAPAFTTAATDVSGRAPRTKAQVKWSADSVALPAGASAGTDISPQGIKLKTADLSAVLSEVIGQDGWASGNSLVLIFADDKDNPSKGVRAVDAQESGANYAPLLHIEVASDQAAAPKANIIWVSDAFDDKKDNIRDDQGWIDFLTAEGYNIDYRMGPALGNGFWRTLDQAKLDALNAADLVIFSRNANSGDYNNGNERDQWNSVKTPLLLLSPHLTRSSHWKWLNTTTLNKAVPMMQPTDPNSPAFKGVTRDAKGQIAVLGATVGTSFPGIKTAGNGAVLATRADTGDIWIASWAAGKEFYTGSGQVPAGPRVFFAAGLEEVAATATAPALGRGEFNLADSGKAVFLNVVDMLLP